MAGQPEPENKRRKVIRLRHYAIDDAQLFQDSRTARQLFLDNLAPFNAFDPELNNGFANDWMAKIKECESLPTDETDNDGLRQHTSDVDEARKACLSEAIGLEYYVKLAFPNDALILREFGFTERQKVRGQAVNTLVWALTMRRVAQDYGVELTAVNMPAAIMSGLQNAANLLGQRELEQEYFKRQVIRGLRLRIKKFNELYGMFTRVHAAAQSVFSDDKERRGLFNLT